MLRRLLDWHGRRHRSESSQNSQNGQIHSEGAVGDWAANGAEQYPCARHRRARTVRTRRTRTVSGPRDWRLPLAEARVALLTPRRFTVDFNWATHRVRLSAASARISTSRASQCAVSAVSTQRRREAGIQKQPKMAAHIEFSHSFSCSRAMSTRSHLSASPYAAPRTDSMRTE